MSDGPEPTPERLSEHAIPATYRRAPRTERFIVTGVLIGAAVGLVLGLVLPAGTAVGRATASILMVIAGAVAGGLVSGTQAAILDYMSGRSADRQREAIEADAQVPSPDAALDAGAGTASDAPTPASATDLSPSTDDEGTADGPR